MLYNAWPVIITALLHALLCLSTYSTTQTGAHTHTLHLVLTVIYSTLALSPTLSVCSQTASQLSERERQRGRQRVGGEGGLKVKETKRENLEWSVHSEQRLRICMITWLCACVCVWFFGPYAMCLLLRKFPSFTRWNPLWAQQFSRYWRLHNLI